MEDRTSRSVFSAIANFLATSPTPDEILLFHLPDDLQTRAHDLLERNVEGSLSFNEQQGMRDYMRADEFMALLKAKVKLKLKNEAQE